MGILPAAFDFRSGSGAVHESYQSYRLLPAMVSAPLLLMLFAFLQGEHVATAEVNITANQSFEIFQSYRHRFCPVLFALCLSSQATRGCALLVVKLTGF